MAYEMSEAYVFLFVAAVAFFNSKLEGRDNVVWAVEVTRASHVNITPNPNWLPRA